jgi:hypothetical protein
MFEKSLNIKFYETLSREIGVVPCGQMEGRKNGQI